MTIRAAFTILNRLWLKSGLLHHTNKDTTVIHMIYYQRLIQIIYQIHCIGSGISWLRRCTRCAFAAKNNYFSPLKLIRHYLFKSLDCKDKLYYNNYRYKRCTKRRFTRLLNGSWLITWTVIHDKQPFNR